MFNLIATLRIREINEAKQHKHKRLAMGDFNKLLNSSNKLGGRPLIPSRVHAFHSCLSSGPRCTWTNKNWDWRRHIRERLDKAFSNADGQVAFPKGHCLTLPRLHSEHHPIMVSMDGWDPHRPMKQFLYQPMWQTHPLFHLVVANCWSNHEAQVHDSAQFTVDFYKKKYFTFRPT